MFHAINYDKRGNNMKKFGKKKNYTESKEFIAVIKFTKSEYTTNYTKLINLIAMKLAEYENKLKHIQNGRNKEVAVVTTPDHHKVARREISSLNKLNATQKTNLISSLKEQVERELKPTRLVFFFDEQKNSYRSPSRDPNTVPNTLVFVRYSKNSINIIETKKEASNKAKDENMANECNKQFRPPCSIM